MNEKRFHKGDWSNSICEVYDGEEYIGGVQLNCADEFIDLLNSLNEENMQLKQFKEDVFKLIDKRIDKCEPTDYVRNIKGDFPVFDCETATEIRVLNELKMELQK